MKVIINETGFYGGTYYEAGSKPQEMPEAIARQFAAPYGDQVTIQKKEAEPTQPVKAEKVEK